MVTLGYKLCSEERTATELVRDAIAAEEAGFGFAAISDHFHPWLDAQGESPFVWSVLGAVAASTSTLRVGTAVTCPIARIHPALVAQAAATTAQLLDGRFFLGLGSGENLNEHIVGGRWPSATERREALLDAVEVIKELFGGDFVSYNGEYFSVDRAKLYSLPDEPPRIYLAASGLEAASAAGEFADGLLGTAPDADLLAAFSANGGDGKPRIGELTVCFGEDQESAAETLRARWPMPGIPGELPSELPLPRHFEQAAQLVQPGDLGEIPTGPAVGPYLAAIDKYERAGYDHITIHQAGPDQEHFFAFATNTLFPQLRAA